MGANAPSRVRAPRPTESPRRPENDDPGPAMLPLRVANIELWPDLQVFVSGRRVDLTRREFDVLHALAARPGQLLSKDLVHRLAWRSPRFHPRDRSVAVYVRKLRLKLGAASPEWRYIHTHHGLGYRFDPERIDR